MTAWQGVTLSGNGPGNGPTADLLALLDADPHGCALARSVRAADGRIVDFTLVYLNAAGSRFLGRPPEELVGRRYRELWPETVTDGTLPIYVRVVQDRVPAVRTVYYDRATVAGHFEFRVVPFDDGFVARFVDLTKLTMGSQTEGGARLYEALDAAFDGFTLLRAVRDDDRRDRGLRLRVRQPDRRQARRQQRRGPRRTTDRTSPSPAPWSPACSNAAGRSPTAVRPGSNRSALPSPRRCWELKIARVDAGVRRGLLPRRHRTGRAAGATRRAVRPRYAPPRTVPPRCRRSPRRWSPPAPRTRCTPRWAPSCGRPPAGTASRCC